jgi:Protein of unknown function (DUF2971)
MEGQEPQQTENPPKPEGLLYHYTSMDGFIGILNSDSLRATHIKYMNDSNEFIDALKHLHNLIDEFDATLQPMLLKLMESTIAKFSGRFGAYVISFTDDGEQSIDTDQMPGDRLSQWRAYAGGGRGISLGFDYESLDIRICGSKWTTAWNTRGPKTVLLNCKYRSYEKRMYFQRLGSALAHNLDQLQEALYPFLFSAATFKDSAFFEEKEWRIVTLLSCPDLPDGNSESSLVIPIKFRSGIVGITPYIEPPLGLATSHSPLRRIVVGPTPHMQDAVKGVEMAIEDKGIALKSTAFPTGVEVVPSQIPYRN